MTQKPKNTKRKARQTPPPQAPQQEARLPVALRTRFLGGLAPIR